MTVDIMAPLILILFIGLPHGAADILIARRMFSYNYFYLSLFLSSYLILVSIIILIWFLAPFWSLGLFLIISIHHFGLMDTNKSKTMSFRYVRVIIFGSMPIMIPSTFHTTDVNYLFALLLFEEFHEFTTFIVQLFPIWLLGCLLFFIKAKDLLKYEFIEMLFLALILAYLSPLWGFALYFCLVHSLRHTKELLESLGFLSRDDYLSLIIIVVVSIVLIFIGAYMLQTITFDTGIIRAAFIGLAALTIPHIILIDWYSGLNRIKGLPSIKKRQHTFLQ